MPDGDESTWKDFTIAVDDAEYGVSRDLLVRALRAEDVDTRRYFDPPCTASARTRGSATRRCRSPSSVSAGVVSLPMFRSLPESTVDRIVEIMALVHEHASEVAAAE